jgi:RNA polymerase sigma-70 factor (ECF subfamily)
MPPEPTLRTPHATAELRNFLLARVRALPFEYRTPLVLRDIEGLSNQEVADVLGISLAATKSRIHRARMQIRTELEEWERR